MNYYELLEISVDATPNDIKIAYRKAAKKHHPDTNRQSTHKAMAEVNKAYEILCNPDSRKLYDLQHGIAANYQRYQEQGTNQNRGRGYSANARPGFDDTGDFYKNGGFDKMWEDMMRGMKWDQERTHNPYEHTYTEQQPPYHPNARASGWYTHSFTRQKLTIRKIKEVLREELQHKKNYVAFNNTECDFCDKDIQEKETFVFMYEKQKMCTLCVKDILKHL